MNDCISLLSIIERSSLRHGYPNCDFVGAVGHGNVELRDAIGHKNVEPTFETAKNDVIKKIAFETAKRETMEESKLLLPDGCERWQCPVEFQTIDDCRVNFNKRGDTWMQHSKVHVSCIVAPSNVGVRYDPSKKVMVLEERVYAEDTNKNGGATRDPEEELNEIGEKLATIMVSPP